MTEPDNTVLLVDVMQMVTSLHRKAEDIADGDLLDRLSRFVAFARDTRRHCRRSGRDFSTKLHPS
ncbi:hypothetical protein [Cupriavidus sp. TMH.W2]|uniref:hypothetical protein n=1 Tax=Cupriavidus sp. TMH.W2 TaxID=3434465 RepID=UPI003D774447